MKTGSINATKYGITQKFGEDPDYYKRAIGTNGHPGVDTGQKKRQDVYCEEDGVVIGKYHLNPSAGNFLVVKTAGGTMRYLHLDSYLVNQGVRIKRGQVIGKAGDTGLAFGAHLHLDFKPKVYNPWNGFGGRVDPIKYLEKYLVVPKKPTIHVVRRGESLSSIASRYKTTWQNIQKLNVSRYPTLARNPNLIHPGWKLIIKK